MDLKTMAQNMRNSIASAVPSAVVALSYGGQVCTNAVRSNVSAERVESLYGQLSGYSFSVYVPADFFDAPVESGKRAFVNDVEYQIIGTAVDAAGANLRLDLGDKYA